MVEVPGWSGLTWNEYFQKLSQLPPDLGLPAFGGVKGRCRSPGGIQRRIHPPEVLPVGPAKRREHLAGMRDVEQVDRRLVAAFLKLNVELLKKPRDRHVKIVADRKASPYVPVGSSATTISFRNDRTAFSRSISTGSSRGWDTDQGRKIVPSSPRNTTSSSVFPTSIPTTSRPSGSRETATATSTPLTGTDL